MQRNYVKPLIYQSAFFDDCLSVYCSDARSYEYYNESITNESVFVSEFNDELNEPNTNQITKNKNLLTNSMGHNVNKR
jgi:hypothetical protein